MSSKTGLIITIVVAILLGFYIYPTAFDKLNIPIDFEPKAFKLGLDLQGGTHLVYQADTTDVAVDNLSDAMDGVRDVIERRVNLFGVSEPLVQIEGNDRLIVELAGISNVNEAIALIGETPFLEFKEQSPLLSQEEFDILRSAQIVGERLDEEAYTETGLTGQYLERSQLVFDQFTGVAAVSLDFNDEGAQLFEEITKRNVGQFVAIYLDGIIIQEATVSQVIADGRAQISGRNITVGEGRLLMQRLNAGALPVPITLISQQTVGPSLGEHSLNQSLKAGMYGLVAVALFMLAYYRVSGAAAVIALAIYVVIVLALYKFFGVTLTLAGIAGFILSLGIAVDANVLIFERMKEELKAGKTVSQAVNEGFRRAWSSIRDAHITTLLGALVLYLFTTSFVKGFALTLGIGVLISLFTAVVVTKALLQQIVKE